MSEAHPLAGVTFLVHRPVLRIAVESLLREVPAPRGACARSAGDHHSFPVLVDAAKIFSRTVSSRVLSLESAVVLAMRQDADEVFAGLREGIPVHLVEDLKPETLSHLLGATDHPTGLYGRLSQLTARRIREFLARRSACQPLSPQEAIVLDLLRRGCGNREIADQLGLQPKTVKNHLTHIYAKLGVSGRYGAMACLGGEPTAASVRLVAGSRAS